MSSFRQYLEKVHTETEPSRINEASLGRVYQHFLEMGEKSFAIVSAWKTGTQTTEENSAAVQRLRNDLSSMGYGYFQLRGNWTGNTPEESGSEPAFFVIGITRAQAMKLCVRYDQEAVLWAGILEEGEEAQVFILYQNGKVEKKGRFIPMQIAKNYSVIKGKPFFFECVASSWSESLIEGV